MLAEIRKCAEANDIKGLRYIFVDCLDVDPTFEKYEEDYNYCKNIPGLFDAHANLSGMISDSKRWNSSYWDQLKLDLMKNFSKERFEHMIHVAKIVYADKIARLTSERHSLKDSRAVNTVVIKDTIGKNVGTTGSREQKKISDAELQKRILDEKRLALIEENRRIEAEQAAQRARIEAAKRESSTNNSLQAEKNVPKKALGIVLGIIVIVVVALTLIKAMQ